MEGEKWNIGRLGGRRSAFSILSEGSPSVSAEVVESDSEFGEHNGFQISTAWLNFNEKSDETEEEEAVEVRKDKEDEDKSIFVEYPSSLLMQMSNWHPRKMD